MPSLKRVYEEFRAESEWLFVYVREAHPGENFQAHASYEQKVRQAELFRRAENLPWPVLVDDLAGTVHRAYGELPNPVFLIDTEGRVAFRGDFSHGPTLHRALRQLLDQGGHGAVPEGEDKRPHMLGATAFGWGALERGGKQSIGDVVRRMPPLAANLWLGDKMRSALAPLASRDRPLPPAVKWAIAGLLVAAAVAVARRRR